MYRDIKFYSEPCPFLNFDALVSLSEKIRQSKLQKGKEDLEAELRRLDSKSEGLRAQINGNGLTVATRVSTAAGAAGWLPRIRP